MNLNSHHLSISIPQPQPTPDKNSRIILWQQEKIVSNGSLLWHSYHEGIEIGTLFFVATKDNIHYFTALTLNNTYANPLISLRELLGFVNEDALLYQRAASLIHWRSHHKYCSRCSTPLIYNAQESSLNCSACKHHFYPTIAPCIIVLVTDGPKVLLIKTNQQQQNNLKFFTTIAGYIESGESAEHAVHREVKEETNIDIHNVQYLNSQHWPFPNQLMLGFHACYKSGEIAIDSNEISAADWFDINALPQLPPPISIAHWLISHYINTHT